MVVIAVSGKIIFKVLFNQIRQYRDILQFSDNQAQGFCGTMKIFYYSDHYHYEVISILELRTILTCCIKGSHSSKINKLYQGEKN